MCLLSWLNGLSAAARPYLAEVKLPVSVAATTSTVVVVCCVSVAGTTSTVTVVGCAAAVEPGVPQIVVR